MPHTAEGLWAVKFVGTGTSVPQNVGAGIIVVIGNAVLGGDNQYAYDGTLSIANDVVNADINVRLHNPLSGGQSIFGPVDHFGLLLTGKLSDKEMVLGGRMKENAGAAISIQCSKLKNLP